MIKNFNCIKFKVFTFLIVLTCFFNVKAGVIKWKVIQTTFKIEHEEDLLHVSHYFCNYCGNIIIDACQDVNGDSICKSCGETMQSLLCEYQDKNKESLLCAMGNSFPRSKQVGINLEKVHGRLIRTLSSKQNTSYTIHQDIAKENLINKLDKGIISCEDCKAKVSAKDIVYHSYSHLQQCRLCEYTFNGEYAERKKLLEDHVKSCKKSCSHCDQFFTIDHFENHQRNCPEQSIKCTAHSCRHIMKLNHLGEHCAKRLMQEEHEKITCPLCFKIVFGASYEDHYGTLHKYNDSMLQKCYECGQAFGSGVELIEHFTQKHFSSVTSVMALEQSSLDSGSASKKNLVHIFRVFKDASMAENPEKNKLTEDDLEAISQMMKSMLTDKTPLCN